ncbi:hypothetical protein HYPSUDRAFT_1090755 [Hypholoma sublateritium FD-334 SS-4]|uniref:Uncharacterized protein n=1 Tax=Hypholoma sublateritium (strain FD-334 SS-4) TaxID=945553 RepID=A0A0D2NP87_HYPSF|nr:hypothetical protein HYPSUDRAFT_1090755 [Hypholoma sublateritium FD-334 SS-4]
MTSENQINRKVYEGTQRKLVLAFDVGTTFSGISYSILEPGQEPTIRGVTRFPAQDNTHGASKIPTIMYYDKAGNVCAAGAEATRDGIEVEAEDNGWVKAEWFKLHLRNKDLAASTPAASIHPLPPKKRAIDLLADFLSYLYTCAAQYIQETHLNGLAIWNSVKDEINYVLSHPNGWTWREQREMRKAAFMAGLIPHKAHPRLSFVTEGEASLHFCIQAGKLASHALESDRDPGFVIVDAGGGTIDISAYKQTTDTEARVFEEIAPAQCIFQGSVYVNVYAKKVLLGLLEGSKFADDIDHIVNVFERSSKHRFKDDKDPQYIKFGGTRDNDASRKIRFGQLKLDGSDVAALFQPAIDAIVEAVLLQKEAATHKISHVLFVGGFAANTWLFNSVSRILTEKGTSIDVVRPEEHIAKAVADGSMSFFLDHFVRTRVSKLAYGIAIRVPYNPSDPEHILRAQKIYYSEVTERRHLYGIFATILSKNVQVPEAQVYRRKFRRDSLSDLDIKKKLKYTILGYKGLDANPTWIDLARDDYPQLCTIEAELICIPIMTRHTFSGKQYYVIDFEILLFFGLTELNAQIAWKNSEVSDICYRILNLELCWELF